MTEGLDESDAPILTGADLDRSRLFDPLTTLVGPAGEAAVDAFLDDLAKWEDEPKVDADGVILRDTRRDRGRKKRDALALRVAMSAMLANLYALSLHPRTRDHFLSVSFGNSDYPQGLSGLGRYHRSLITITAMVTVRDYLQGRRLVVYRRGFNSIIGRRSRMRATAKLVEWLAGLGVQADQIGTALDRELIILKGKPLKPKVKAGGAKSKGRPRRLSKPFRGYGDTDQTIAWRKVLTTINERLVRASIGYPEGAPLDGEPGEDNHGGIEGTGMPQGSPGDLTPRTLFRIFNDGSWERGGRLYGGYWQCISEESRRAITIDGELTIELDFHHLHPRFLYLEQGSDFTEDAYEVRIAGQLVNRDLCKTTLNRLLNGSSGERRLASRKEDRELLPPGVTLLQVEEALREKHVAIAQHFGTGVGLRLQRTDSDIAMDVLTGLSCGRDIVVLPVHDSFIVQERHRDDLREAMTKALWAHSRVGIDPMIDDGS